MKHGDHPQYKLRDAAYAQWDEGRFPSMSADGAGVFDHLDASRIVQEAFNAGWQARKVAVDYALGRVVRPAAPPVSGLTPNVVIYDEASPHPTRMPTATKAD